MASGTSRERILKAAVELIGQHGYRETTVGDIEAAAGLTRRAGGFYRHFKSKEAVLIEALRLASTQMIGQIRLAEIVSLKSPRAELLTIARSILRHAAAQRPLRLILQREAHHLPALGSAARRANARLAALDVVPWVADVLKRARIRGQDPRTLALLIFGPVLLYMISLDRGDPAFGLDEDAFLGEWADHWARWLAHSERAP